MSKKYSVRIVAFGGKRSRLLFCDENGEPLPGQRLLVMRETGDRKEPAEVTVTFVIGRNVTVE